MRALHGAGMLALSAVHGSLYAVGGFFFFDDSLVVVGFFSPWGGGLEGEGERKVWGRGRDDGGSGVFLDKCQGLEKFVISIPLAPRTRNSEKKIAFGAFGTVRYMLKKLTRQKMKISESIMNSRRAPIFFSNFNFYAPLSTPAPGIRYGMREREKHTCALHRIATPATNISHRSPP